MEGADDGRGGPQSPDCPWQVRPGGGATSEDKRQLFFCWSVLSLALLLARDSESLGFYPLQQNKTSE